MAGVGSEPPHQKGGVCDAPPMSRAALLILPALMAAAPASASCWATFDNLPVGVVSDGTEPHRTVSGATFDLPGEAARGEACLWLVDDGEFLEADAENCHPGVEACARIRLREPVVDLEGARAWLAIDEAAPRPLLLTTTGEPCGPRPAPGPSLGTLRAEHPTDPIALPLPGDDGGVIACAWTTAGPAIPLPACPEARPGCGLLQLDALGPGTHTVVVSRGGTAHTVDVVVPNPRCAPPAPSELGPTTPRRSVRLNADGSLRLTLDHSPAADAEACLAFPGAQPANVPQRLPVADCPDGQPRCVDVPVDLGRTWAVGSYPLDIVVGDGTVHRLSLHLPPPWWILILLAGFGFLLSTGGTLLAQAHVARARFARRLERVRTRLRGQVEIHEPLVARVRALLRFASRRLSEPWFSLRRLVALTHFDPALAEADQLLALSARKGSLWRRATAVGLSPTARIRFNGLLRQLDHEILSLRLPLTPDKLADMTLPSEAAAKALLAEVQLDFASDVRGNLDTLGEPLPPPIDEDEDIELGPLLERSRQEESARLQVLQGQSPLSPLAMREVDLRLDVLRSIEAAQQDIAEGDAPPDLFQVKRALRRWRNRDLREPQPADIHHDLLRALRWLPHNERVERRMRAIVTPQQRADCSVHKPLLTLVEAPSVWSTFRPVPLKVVVHDEQDQPHWLNDAYLWRRLLVVEWTVRCDDGAPPVQPGTAGEVTTSEGGRCLTWTGQSPEAVVFAVDEARLQISARVSAPTRGNPTWYEAAPLAVRVERSQDERFLASLQVDGMRRLLLNVGLVVGLVGLLAWQAAEGRQGLLPYLWAFLLPFGVDLATLATPKLGQFASDLLGKVYRV